MGVLSRSIAALGTGSGDGAGASHRTNSTEATVTAATPASAGITAAIQGAAVTQRLDVGNAKLAPGASPGLAVMVERAEPREDIEPGPDGTGRRVVREMLADGEQDIAHHIVQLVTHAQPAQGGPDEPDLGLREGRLLLAVGIRHGAIWVDAAGSISESTSASEEEGKRGAAHFAVGSLTRPMKRIIPERTSRTKKR